MAAEPPESSQPLPDLSRGRERELAKLASSFRRGHRFLAIEGVGGVGKTTLARVFAATCRDIFPGGVTYINAMTDRAPNVAYSGNSRYLVVIDDAHYLPDDAIRSIQKAFGASPFLDFLITLRPGDRRFRPENVIKLPAPATVTEAEVAYTSAEEATETAIRPLLAPSARAKRPRSKKTTKPKPLVKTRIPPRKRGADDVRFLLRGTPAERYADELSIFFDGDPEAVVYAGRALSQGLSWSKIIREVASFRREGLLRPDGTSVPIDGASPIITDISAVNRALLLHLGDDPTTWYDLSPRKFEEVVAELLSRQGYEVTLTPLTHDGGFDIAAARRDDLGEFLFLVECKRYVPPQKVGVRIVRALQGVLAANRATGAAIVTTSFFTQQATEFQEQFRYSLKLHDYIQLQRWVKGLRT